MCDPGDGLGGRESISIFAHTNDFVGIFARDPEPAGTADNVNQGRWVYEGGEKRAGHGNVGSPDPTANASGPAGPGRGRCGGSRSRPYRRFCRPCRRSSPL